MKQFIFALSIAIILLLLAPGATAGGHCWYSGTISQPAPDLNFGDKFREITDRAVDGTRRETYIVPEGSKLIVQKLDNTFVASCVNGAAGSFLSSVRLMKIKPDGTKDEVSGNYTYGGEACSGGNTVIGAGTSFTGYNFSITGAHTFELQYKQTLASAVDDWKMIKVFDVLVAPGRIEVTPFKKPLVGLKHSVYGQENSVQREVLWKVANVGGIDVNITGIRVVECKGNLSGCEFPNFRAGGSMVLKSDENIFIRESFTATKPASSPAKDALSIDILFSDVYGFLGSNLTTGKSPIEKEVKFNVVASAVYPYRKSGTFGVGGDRNYYVQTCSDSKFTSSFDRPLFGMDVYDELGNPVLSTNFHEVSDCKSAEGLSYGNGFTDEFGQGALKKFRTVSFSGAKTYRYEVVGIVGVGSNYKSDFARIGTKFNEATQLVEGLVVDDNLGRQERIYSVPDPPAGYHAFSLNAFTSPKNLGQYRPALTDTGIGSVSYMLSEVLVDGTRINSTPTQRAEAPETSVSIDKDGVVIANTSAVEEGNRAPPSVDVNLAWADEERYMFESKGLESGVCRTLQGDAIALGNAGTATGPGAKVRLKYDWRPDTITENFCDPANPDYVYCDATQFSIVLLRKLKQLDGKAGRGLCGEVKNGLDFQAFLMRDGFSEDFQKDFDYYLRNEFASNPLGYSANPQASWQKYFPDPQRLAFANSEITRPMLYKVNVNVAFEEGFCTFFSGEQGEPRAKITVSFTEAGLQGQKNLLLYYLPIDGAVGKRPVEGAQPSAGMHRDGYGVGFKGNSISIFKTSDSRYEAATQQMAENSTPVAVVEISETRDFLSINRNNPGQLLRIDKKGNGLYSLSFAPSVPVPALMLAEGKPSTERNNISVAYQLFEANQPVVSTSSLARLTEIGFQKGGKIGCADPTYIDPATQNALALPALAPNGNQDPLARSPITIGFDKQLAAFSTGNFCTLQQSATNQENTYFFSREGPSDGNILLQAMVYVPSKVGVDIRNACAQQGRLYVGGGSSAAGYQELKPGSGSFTLHSGTGEFGSLAEVLEAIPAGSTCIAYGTELLGGQRSPKSVGIWWNEGKISNEFLIKVQPKFGNNKFCGT